MYINLFIKLYEVNVCVYVCVRESVCVCVCMCMCILEHTSLTLEKRWNQKKPPNQGF